MTMDPEIEGHPYNAAEEAHLDELGARADKLKAWWETVKTTGNLNDCPEKLPGEAFLFFTEMDPQDFYGDYVGPVIAKFEMGEEP